MTRVTQIQYSSKTPKVGSEPASEGFNIYNAHAVKPWNWNLRVLACKTRSDPSFNGKMSTLLMLSVAQFG